MHRLQVVGAALTQSNYRDIQIGLSLLMCPSPPQLDECMRLTVPEYEKRNRLPILERTVGCSDKKPVRTALKRHGRGE